MIGTGYAYLDLLLFILFGAFLAGLLTWDRERM